MSIGEIFAGIVLVINAIAAAWVLVMVQRSKIASAEQAKVIVETVEKVEANTTAAIKKVTTSAAKEAMDALLSAQSEAKSR